MTVPATPRRAGPYDGTGAQTAFPFSFKAFDESDVRVVELDVPTNVETDATLNTDYTVALNPDQESTPGGTVNYLVAPSIDKKITLIGSLAFEQPVDLPDGGAYRAQQVEDGLDRLAICLQQLKEITDRCAQVPVSQSDAQGLIESINVLSANLATLQAVVDNISDLVTLAAVSSEVSALAAVAADIPPVAAVAPVIPPVAAIASDIAVAAANIVAIQDAPAQAAAAAASANSAEQSALAAISALANVPGRNRIVNPFTVNQRGVTSAADDTYCLDRWYVLTPSGNVTVAQITDPESGAPFAIRLTQPDIGAKRVGLATIIESKDIRAYRNVAMNFAVRAKASFAGNVRYAILEHTGAADSVTSDVVNSWSNPSFTPGQFFIAGLNVLKTGAVAPGAGVYGDLSDWAVLGPAANNVILVVWSESDLVQGATLELNRPQYEAGVVRTPQEWRMNELDLCQRYWRTGTIDAGGGAGLKYANASGANWHNSAHNFNTEMRASPTIGIAGAITYENCSAIAFVPGADGFSTRVNVAAAGVYRAYGATWVASAEL